MSFRVILIFFFTEQNYIMSEVDFVSVLCALSPTCYWEGEWRRQNLESGPRFWVRGLRLRGWHGPTSGLPTCAPPAQVLRLPYRPDLLLPYRAEPLLPNRLDPIGSAPELSPALWLGSDHCRATSNWAKRPNKNTTIPQQKKNKNILFQFCWIK